MWKWFKKLRYVVANFDSFKLHVNCDIEALKLQARRVDAIIKEQVQYGADVHFTPDKDYVIVLGRYRNHDYVRCFTLHNKHLQETVETLRDMEKSYGAGRIDCPPTMKHVIRHRIDGGSW